MKANHPHLFRALAIALLAVLPLASMAQDIGANPDNRLFSQAIYTSPPPASAGLAQVVVLRPASGVGRSAAAHIYVDGRLNNALLEGGYGRFCVLPGLHTIEVYQNDFPLYAGKQNPRLETELAGGRTYFLKVDENVDGSFQSLTQANAEQLLTNGDMHGQIHILNRAEVVACPEWASGTWGS